MIKRLLVLDDIVCQIPEKTKVYILACISLIIFCIMLQLNIMTHMQGDDYVYSFKYPTTERINSFLDLWQSQYTHYQKWGGRSVAHVIAQVLLTLPPLVIDILNSLVFVLFIFLIYLHVKGRSGKHSLIIYVMIFLLTWFIQRAFADTVLAVTSSANYLWCFTLTLLFLLPFRFSRGLNVLSKGKSTLYSIGLFLLGIVAGWTNENIGVASLVMIFIFFLFVRKEKMKIPIWSLCAWFGLLTGFLFMILAPGNYVRAAEMQMPTSLFYFSYRFRLHTNEFISYLGLLNVIIFVFSVLLFKFRQKDLKYVYRLSSVYMIGVLVSLYSMIASPFFPDRAWFGIISLNIIVFLVVFYHLDYTFRFMRIIKYGLFSLFLLAYPFSFYFAYKDINRVDTEWQHREGALQDAKEKGLTSLEFQSVGETTKFVMGDYSDYCPIMSSYYNLEIDIVK